MRYNINFLLLFFGRLISRLGDSVFIIGVSWYILELTGSGVQMASFIAVTTLTVIIAGPVGGNLVDQYAKIKLLYLMDFLRGGVVLLAAATLLFSSNTTFILVVLYVMAIISGLATVVFNPASSAAIPLIMTKEELIKANSLMAISGSVTGILGVALGGIVYAFIGPFGIFLVDGITYILSGISEMFINVEEKKIIKMTGNHPIKDQLDIFKEGISYLKDHKALIYIGIFAAVLNFSLNPTFQVYQPFLIESILNREIQVLSIISICISGGMLTGGIILSVTSLFLKEFNIVSMLRRFTFILIIFLGMFTLIVHSIAVDLVAFKAFLIMYCVAGYGVGILVAMVNIPIDTYIQTNTDPSKMGRVNSVVNTLAMIATPVAVMMGGVIVDVLPIQIAYLISTVLLTLTSGLLLFRKELGQLEKQKEIGEEV